MGTVGTIGQGAGVSYADGVVSRQNSSYSTSIAKILDLFKSNPGLQLEIGKYLLKLDETGKIVIYEKQDDGSLKKSDKTLQDVLTSEIGKDRRPYYLSDVIKKLIALGKDGQINLTGKSIDLKAFVKLLKDYPKHGMNYVSQFTVNDMNAASFRARAGYREDTQRGISAAKEAIKMYENASARLTQALKGSDERLRAPRSEAPKTPTLPQNITTWENGPVQFGFVDANKDGKVNLTAEKGHIYITLNKDGKTATIQVKEGFAIMLAQGMLKAGKNDGVISQAEFGKRFLAVLDRYLKLYYDASLKDVSFASLKSAIEDFNQTDASGFEDQNFKDLEARKGQLTSEIAKYKPTPGNVQVTLETELKFSPENALGTAELVKNVPANKLTASRIASAALLYAVNNGYTGGDILAWVKTNTSEPQAYGKGRSTTARTLSDGEIGEQIREKVFKYTIDKAKHPEAAAAYISSLTATNRLADAERAKELIRVIAKENDIEQNKINEILAHINKHEEIIRKFVAHYAGKGDFATALRYAEGAGDDQKDGFIKHIFEKAMASFDSGKIAQYKEIISKLSTEQERADHYLWLAAKCLDRDERADQEKALAILKAHIPTAGAKITQSNYKITNSFKTQEPAIRTLQDAGIQIPREGFDYNALIRSIQMKLLTPHSIYLIEKSVFLKGGQIDLSKAEGKGGAIEKLDAIIANASSHSEFAHALELKARIHRAKGDSLWAKLSLGGKKIDTKAILASEAYKEYERTAQLGRSAAWAFGQIAQTHKDDTIEYKYYISKFTAANSNIAEVLQENIRYFGRKEDGVEKRPSNYKEYKEALRPLFLYILTNNSPIIISMPNRGDIRYDSDTFKQKVDKLRDPEHKRTAQYGWVEFRQRSDTPSPTPPAPVAPGKSQPTPVRPKPVNPTPPVHPKQVTPPARPAAPPVARPAAPGEKPVSDGAI